MVAWYGMNHSAVWFAVVDVVVVCAFVLYEAGIAAIPGCVLIFLTQPLQVRHSLWLLNI